MSNTDRASPSLRRLRAIDRLEVGPVRIEPRRLVAPYVVRQGDRSDSFELCYRYEEDVFEADHPGSANLAAMIASQVALNYGLFCGEIVFPDALDAHDQRFLREMAENTAREIFVKKLLQPNPFLDGAFRDLVPARRDRFLTARLIFPGATDHYAAGDWETDPARVVVLSSGGKDSLLTYGLLSELNCEVHPIYVNESGRHWFTALNAYRHFAAHVPHTSRVWTNSDRLFSWMLRQLPFVRPDFSRLRTDQYPLRLWTVAVFLFGTLPVVKRRGVGRLAIGDEFDTTDRRTHDGITHYNGLYDQSRYCDRYMTRYFQRKHWNLTQCSLLRPLSELLIQKVLTERYPALQRLQVSCHAAHVERPAENGSPSGACLPSDTCRTSASPNIGLNDRSRGSQVEFRPCGNCEKCRRIVGMLQALGGDPACCGYAPAQIAQALDHLIKRGATLEKPALEHLAYLLSQQGRLPGTRIGNVTAHERSEIMKLRFDPQRSPFEDIPVDLRRPLFSLLLQHAAGAVRRSGQAWVEFDVLTDPVLSLS